MTVFKDGELPQLGLEERAEVVEERKTKAVRAQGRDAAVLRGRLYGQDEARRRKETGALRDERVNRAMAYAAWEYDGKPFGDSERYEIEFGTKRAPVADSMARGGPDHKPEKKQR